MPMPQFDVEFVLGREATAERRHISSSHMMQPGMEVRLDAVLWRVIRVEHGDGDPVDQHAFLIRIG
jgi:hypothetical protein